MPSQIMYFTMHRGTNARALIVFLACCSSTAPAQSNGPDIIVGGVTTGRDASEPCVATWGPVGGMYGFVNEITASNIGDKSLPAVFPLQNSNQHPAVAFDLYQLKTSPFERFQQIGMSWINHDDWETPDPSCPGPGLYPGCSDTYRIPTQATKLLGPRWSVNAFTGNFPMNETINGVGCGGTCCPVSPSTASMPFPGFLQVKGIDIECPPSPQNTYFFEGHFVTPGESAFGNQFNNVSYAKIETKWVDRTSRADCTNTCAASACTWWFDSGYPPYATVQQQPAIHAWKLSNPSSVIETQIDVPCEGRFILSALATKLVPTCTVDCWYSYEYALYNMNSDRSAGGFRVALPNGLSPPDVRFPINLADKFHDIHYHSGDEAQFDGTDWSSFIEEQPHQVRWTVASNSTNALRWGTLYNFRFEAKRPPLPHYSPKVTVNLFKPGPPDAPTSVIAASVVPAPSGPPPACPVHAAPQAACGNPKNRFLSIIPPGSSGQTAIRVKMIDLQNPVPPNLPQFPPPNFSGYQCAAPAAAGCTGACAPKTCVGGPKNGATCVLPAPVPTDCPSPGVCTAAVESNGCARWVGKPGRFLEAQDIPLGASYRAARLQCIPHYQDWSIETVVNITGAEIVPSSKYAVQMIAAQEEGCSASVEADFSAALEIKTARSGDVEAPFNPPSTTIQPNVTDVTQLVNKFKNAPNALVKAISQLQPNLVELNADISALDIVAVVDAVKQFAYAFSGPCPCPSTVICGPATGSVACTTPGACVTAFGAGALCVETCSGGDNVGDPCINNTHCPGSSCGNGFCRDRCGRCTPPP